MGSDYPMDGMCGGEQVPTEEPKFTSLQPCLLHFSLRLEKRNEAIELCDSFK